MRSLNSEKMKDKRSKRHGPDCTFVSNRAHIFVNPELITTWAVY